MGGGLEEPAVLWGEFQESIARVYQACDTATYGPPADCACIRGDYREVGSLLNELEKSCPIVIDKCAANVEAMHTLRQAARRYEELECSSHVAVERARVLCSSLRPLLLQLRDAFSCTVTPEVKHALSLAQSSLSHQATLLEATAAAHHAVQADVDSLARNTAAVVADPTKADIGISAAPLIGGAAASSLGFILIRAGPLGALGAVALFGLGALGANEVTQQAVLPQIQHRFTRLYLHVCHLSSLMAAKATAMEVLSQKLRAASLLLATVLEVPSRGNPASIEVVMEKFASLGICFDEVLARCDGCRYRSTAFLALGMGGTEYSFGGKAKPWPANFEELKSMFSRRR